MLVISRYIFNTLWKKMAKLKNVKKQENRPHSFIYLLILSHCVQSAITFILFSTFYIYRKILASKMSERKNCQCSKEVLEKKFLFLNFTKTIRKYWGKREKLVWQPPTPLDGTNGWKNNRRKKYDIIIFILR